MCKPKTGMMLNSDFLRRTIFTYIFSDTIEPVLKFRKYICKNGSFQEIGVQQSLGVMEPESRNLSVIKDQKICLNSTIELVEIETEIIESGL